MQQESVTEDYLDPLAVVLQSIRGWRRFLVFAELTKSKKKAAWFAIFVHFQRKGAIRILAAEGPRQALNAITIYGVAKAKLVVGDGNDNDSLFVAFFKNIATLAVKERNYAIIFYSMAFTLVIWIFSMIALGLAGFFYIFFVWHHIRPETLTEYCRRKVETRLANIVKAKTDKAWERQEKKEQKDLKKKGVPLDEEALASMKRQPTLPMFDNPSDKSLEKLTTRHPSFSSVSTLPQYSSEPPMNGGFPPRLGRQPTYGSVASNSTSGLLGSAAPMGQSSPYMSRPPTSNSSRSFAHGPPSLPPLSTNGSIDPRYPAAIRPSLMSDRRVSPPSSTPWRNVSSSPSEDSNEEDDAYEMQEGSGLGLPAALRPGGGGTALDTPSALRPGGPRRDMSSPGPQGRGPMPFAQPQRSFTAPNEGPGAHFTQGSISQGSHHYGESMSSIRGPGSVPPQLSHNHTGSFGNRTMNNTPMSATSSRNPYGGPMAHPGPPPSSTTPAPMPLPPMSSFGGRSTPSGGRYTPNGDIRAHTPGGSVGSRHEIADLRNQGHGDGWGRGGGGGGGGESPGMAF
jgi:hypothetical protein